MFGIESFSAILGPAGIGIAFAGIIFALIDFQEASVNRNKMALLSFIGILMYAVAYAIS